jgi:hypothetical protein
MSFEEWERQNRPPKWLIDHLRDIFINSLDRMRGCFATGRFTTEANRSAFKKCLKDAFWHLYLKEFRDTYPEADAKPKSKLAQCRWEHCSRMWSSPTLWCKWRKKQLWDTMLTEAKFTDEELKIFQREVYPIMHISDDV